MHHRFIPKFDIYGLIFNYSKNFHSLHFIPELKIWEQNWKNWHVYVYVLMRVLIFAHLFSWNKLINYLLQWDVFCEYLIAEIYSGTERKNGKPEMTVIKIKIAWKKFNLSSNLVASMNSFLHYIENGQRRRKNRSFTFMSLSVSGTKHWNSSHNCASTFKRCRKNYSWKTDLKIFRCTDVRVRTAVSIFETMNFGAHLKTEKFHD